MVGVSAAAGAQLRKTILQSLVSQAGPERWSLSLNHDFFSLTQSHHPLSMKRNRPKDAELSALNAEWAFPLPRDFPRTRPPKAVSSHRSGSLFLQEGLSPVEAPSGSVGKGKDGRVCQLPNSSFSQFFAGTEAQVWDLPDHLYEVLGVLRGQALELAGTCLEGRCVGHNQNVISFTFAFTYYLFCHLETPIDVGVIGFRNHQFADWNVRSVGCINTQVGCS